MSDKTLKYFDSTEMPIKSQKSLTTKYENNIPNRSHAVQLKIKIRPKKENMCVYGPPTDPNFWSRP